MLSELELSRSKGLLPWQSAMLREQLNFRRRCKARFPDPQAWLWTDRSLSQASDYWSALYKASLFPQGEQIMDACCGAGADLVALASRGPAMGIDSDPAMCLLAASNAVSHGWQVDVRDWTLPQQWTAMAPWLHIDPDRRATGKRTTDAHSFCPDLHAVEAMVQDVRGAVVKLAPSTRFTSAEAEQFAEASHRVWLGNQGECRQQLLLVGELARRPQSRSAVLCEPKKESAESPSVREFSVSDESQIDQMPYDLEQQPRQFVYDLHSVLHASQLQTAWAAQHEMTVLDNPAGYFTSDKLFQSDWAQPFRLIEVVAWDDRKVRRWLRDFGAGPVEVKCRLHKLDANAYQRRYSQPSGRAVTLLVTHLSGAVRAIVAERI